MRTVKIKGVLILDSSGAYVLHGDNEKSSIDMFKLLTGGQEPLWHFDPAVDAAHAVDIEVSVPEMEKSVKAFYAEYPEGIPGN